MSIPVGLDHLGRELEERGAGGYVLTVGDDGAPHVVQAEIVREAGALEAVVGNRTAANAGKRPHVSLLWPARSAEDYSLILDAVATADGLRLRFEPTRAVLHRPGPPPDPSKTFCGSDCVPLLLRPPR
jgi:hypothetical protein